MSRFPETDLFDRVKALDLPLESIIVIGSGAMEAVVGSEKRHAADLDLAVTDEVFDYLKTQPGMEEQAPFTDSGARHLVGNGLDIGMGWNGRSVEHLQQRGYVANGVPIVGLPDVWEFKQDRGSQKDLDDLQIIRNRLYSPDVLPEVIISREMDFVRSCMPEHLHNRPELQIAANGLYLVRTVFGDQGESGARRYSGDLDQGTFATMHGWEHSAIGVKAGQANITMLEKMCSQQGQPKLFSDDDRVDAANAYGNHDVEMGHGRMRDNPDSHDERRAADHAASQAEQFGLSDQRIETTHASILATTFNHQTGRQNIDLAGPSPHVQKLTAAADFSVQRTRHAVSTALLLIPEDLSRTYSGYNAPLARLVDELNADRPAGTPPIQTKTGADIFRLIDQYPDYPVTKTVNGKTQHMTLRDAALQEMGSNPGFFGFMASQTPDEWVVGDPTAPERNAQDIAELTARAKNGEPLATIFAERIKYEASVSDPLAVGGMPGAPCATRSHPWIHGQTTDNSM